MVLGTAIPTITDEFHSLQDTGWYGSAYLFTVCILQTNTGGGLTGAGLRIPADLWPAVLDAAGQDRLFGRSGAVRDRLDHLRNSSELHCPNSVSVMVCIVRQS